MAQEFNYFNKNDHQSVVRKYSIPDAPKLVKSKKIMILLIIFLGFTGAEWFYIGRKFFGFIRLSISLIAITLTIILVVIMFIDWHEYSQNFSNGISWYTEYTAIYSTYIFLLVIITLIEIIYIIFSKRIKTNHGISIH